MVSELSPLVVIVGPTASGKTDLGIELAKKFNGEIICADSRTIYKELNIGTAKPTLKEQELVKHHLIDIIPPDQSFSAAKFKIMAKEAIEDIASHEKLPIMVGGTGLYVDAVLFDFNFLPPADEQLRRRLNGMSVEDLQKEIIDKNITMPINDRNPRHLVRAIEVEGKTSTKADLRANTLVLGLDPGLEVIKHRITDRVNDMLEQGFESEAQAVINRYGLDAPGLRAPGYKAFNEWAENKISYEEAVAGMIREHYLLARRQRTWFKRNKSIHWLNNREEAVEIVTTFLNKKQ